MFQLQVHVQCPNATIDMLQRSVSAILDASASICLFKTRGRRGFQRQFDMLRGQVALQRLMPSHDYTVW